MRSLFALVAVLGGCLELGPSVVVTIEGDGTIDSNGALDCSDGRCGTALAEGESITLHAVPARYSRFVGWSVDECGAEPSCTLTPSRDVELIARFEVMTRTVTVVPKGDGSGTIWTQPAGISCGATCQFEFRHGVDVEVVAVPAEGSQFVGWIGGFCGGTAPCVIPADEDIHLEAHFGLKP